MSKDGDRLLCKEERSGCDERGDSLTNDPIVSIVLPTVTVASSAAVGA
jgi:hypothetical protein